MKRIVAVAGAIAVLGIAGCRQHPAASGAAGKEIHTIALDMSGDSTLVKRFTLLLQAELVGTDLQVVSGEKADVVLKGNFASKVEPRTYGAAIVQQELTKNGKAKTVGSCPTLHSDYEDLLNESHDFEKDVAGAVSDVLRVYPDVETLYIDPNSAFSDSKTFSRSFANEMWDRGVHVVLSPPAAITDRITLSLKKVNVKGSTLHYELRVDSGAESLLNERGNANLQGATGPDVPSFCSGMFADFDSEPEPLIRPAHDAVHAILRANSGQ